jgi:CDP-glucose 4,6-dehydratase
MENQVGMLLRNLDGPVLVSGHSGFKGAWLTRYLSHLGVDVIGYSLPEEPNSLFQRAGLRGKIEEKFADIRDYKSLYKFIDLHRPSAILHLAAQAIVSESYEKPVATFETNVIGTANILEACNNVDSVKAIAVVTTDKVYANANTGVRFRENDPIFGSDPYSASKAATENVVSAWRQIQREGNKLVISSLRSGNVIGGGDLSRDRLIPDLVRGRTSNTKISIRNPESTRPWQHVLDPLRGYIMALEKSISENENQTFNFGPKENSLMVSDVANIFQSRWPSLNLTFDSKKSGHYESILLDLDSTHANEVLHWVPVWNQLNAINKTIEWWDRVLVDQKLEINCMDEQLEEYIKISTDDF